MSQATRALVERLKKETQHLPGNVPLHNKALETITEILDQMVEPAEAPEPEPEATEEGAAVEGEAQSAAEEAATAAEDSEEDDGSGPMSTGNSPT